ncbi:MAG: hypothetical protein HXX15_10685 [Rhodopseudomonas sp.]|uniref:hypothetical protein n=1 Tax=Rhodopseudomonas sp. TaxID=1078 RepID=UPI00181DD23C|nr:hypothetical protein [Rhodopseudomonas sp.]NVN86541.1 hypothetical protein [Rhodopseudomonas sp.]
MQFILAVFIIAALPIAAMAEDKRPVKPLPPRQAKTNPCAAFGPGFVMVEGTSTCVRIGGSISVGAGGRSR